MRKWLKSTETILFNVSDGIARITLNRPEKRNALSLELLRELREALMEADDLREVSCVILDAAGKDFCAGYDLMSTYAEMKKMADGVGANDPNAIDYSKYRAAKTFDDDSWNMERFQDTKMVLFDMHKPVIAKVQGNCLAGGTDIALLCDMVIVTDDAKLGFPPTRAQGSPPNHMWFYHCGPQWAKRLLLTGDSILGRDAARIGLVMDSVAPERLEEVVMNLAKRMASIESSLLSTNKRVVNMAMELMGARTMQRMATEMDARAHLSPSLPVFRQNVAELGLKEALKRRDAPFGDGIARVEAK